MFFAVSAKAKGYSVLYTPREQPKNAVSRLYFIIDYLKNHKRLEIKAGGCESVCKQTQKSSFHFICFSVPIKRND